LERLHGLLVAPLGDAIALYPRLIVVPHGALHYLPFHALHDGQGFLLEQHEISYLPGSSLLRYCKEIEPAASGLLVFGHSYGGRLPHAVREAQAVAAFLGGRTFLEDEATLVRLKGAAGDCRAIHLATHGEFRPDNPLFSGLALADGWLTTLDTFNLRLRASLVALSACRTGQSVIGGGDELLGLMRAFLYAGAASVLLSLWAVEDRSTARLMETFYRKLVEGWTKGAALRYAQRQFIQRQSEEELVRVETYAHPYFWAPFFLVGDAGPL
jgi:CHAT domain-containing protein